MIEKIGVVAGILAASALAAGCGMDDQSPAAEVMLQQGSLVIPNTLVGSGDPGAAIFNGIMFTTFSGTDTHINIMQLLGGGFVKQTLADTTRGGASLAVFNGRLFMGWVGTDAQRKLNVMSTANGVDWTGKIQIEDTMLERPPAMAVINGELWVFGNNGGSGGPFMKGDRFNGTTWNFLLRKTDMQSNDGFTLAPITGTRGIAAWSSTSNQQINARAVDPFQSWGTINLVPSPGGNPSLAPFPGGVVLVQRSAGLTFLRRSSDGLIYPTLTSVPLVTLAKPVAFGATATTVIITWVDNSRRLNVQNFAL